MEPIGDQANSPTLSDGLSDIDIDIGESNEGMDMLKVQEYDFHCKYSVFEDIEIYFPTNPFEVINTFFLGRLCSSLYFP